MQGPAPSGAGVPAAHQDGESPSETGPHPLAGVAGQAAGQPGPGADKGNTEGGAGVKYTAEHIDPEKFEQALLERWKY